MTPHAALLCIAVLVVGCSSTTPDPSAPPSSEAAPAVAGEAATWTVDSQQPPASEARSFTALVTRVQCNGGQTGRVLAPTVTEAADQITITFAVEPRTGFFHTCQSNNQVPYTVDLTEPIGDRTLLDGTCLANTTAMPCATGGAEARWPNESA